ncbi:MAG: hypothetical protein U0Q15_01115 [Kineosporiaceae bacterium]
MRIAPTSARRARTARASAVLVAALFLAGCSAAEDAAGDAAAAGKSKAAEQASKAADAAKSKAAQEARDAVTQQICGIVGDGTVSAPDLTRLRQLVSAAEVAGVPADLLTPVRELVDAGQAQGSEAAARVSKARAACA